MRGRARPASIARPIFLLVLGATLLAALATFAITFGGPPPFARPVPHARVVAALRGEPARGVTVVDGRLPPRPGERADAALGRSIAGRTGGEVAASVAEPQLPDMGAIRGPFTVSARLPGGQSRTVRSEPQPLLTGWHYTVLAALAAMLLLLSVPAWWIARAISRPLEQLAAGARRARVGQGLELPATGSREVRELAAALAGMHDRIGRHAEGRTAMLAAIAHDLGTPLTRLAFHVEGLPEAARARAAADIEEMRAMIAGAIGFARDEAAATPGGRVELGSLLETLADDMRAAGDEVAVAPGPRAVVTGDPAALRRLFANLAGNAVRYGERARIAWRVDDRAVVVTVEDDGPGIDPAEAERLFEPFVRGDPSRNRATGGTGLGLAIARAIAARHGGTAVLENADRGARAVVTLPL